MDEQDYRDIINALIGLLDEGVYIVDHEGVGIFYNRAMAAIEQINVDDVIGKEYHQAFPGVRLSDSTLFQALKRGMSTLNKQQTYFNLYGREITTVNSTVPVCRDGQAVAAIEVANDITNLRSMSDTILELQEKGSVRKRSENGRVPHRPRSVRYTFADIVSSDPAMELVKSKARRAAESSATVFIYGETGTGKELFAQSIHYASPRRSRPFLAQNCAALPESLLEGILFGTERGGFTGAVDRAGLFEQASGGTLLLDEISAMPYALQSKLLRVLQEQYIRRVGGTRDIPVDTRIIATVNEPPQKLIESGRLRRDLYYRLAVVRLEIPPLRERPGDIGTLAGAFLRKYDGRYGKNLRRISSEALAVLSDYDYPGNVRELENIVAQAVSLSGGEEELGVRQLQMPVHAEVMGDDIARLGRRGPLHQYLEELEKEIIRETLIREGGNISRAAADLQLKRQTLQHKIKRFGLKE